MIGQVLPPMWGPASTATPQMPIAEADDPFVTQSLTAGEAVEDRGDDG